MAGIPEPKNTNQEKDQSGKIIYRTLGKTGIKLPVVNMGVMNASLPGLIARSYEKGIRLFDTAWYYQNGMNEKMVGEALAKLGVRDKVNIMTKVFLRETKRDVYAPEIKKLFTDRFEESLKRLQTNYVDILLYHSAIELKELSNPPIMEAFEELKKAGKYRFRGVSLHGDDAAMVDEIVRTKFFDVILVMFNIAYAEDTRLIKSLENAAKEGIAIIAMKTQCGGGGNMWWERHKDSKELLGSLNQKAMLKWVLQHDFISTAIPGYTTYDQLEENFSVAYDISYTEEERKFLEKAQVKLAQSFCTHCEQCRPSCPYNVDIPTLMRTYMYAYQYNNIQHALITEKSIPEEAGLNRCYLCDSCSVACPRSLNVTNRIEALKELNFRYA